MLYWKCKYIASINIFKTIWFRFKKKQKIPIKCPTCIGGPDNKCSDGKCYVKGVGCPTGTALVSTGACTCGYKCSAAFKLCSQGQCTSDLQVTQQKFSLIC